MLSNKEAIDSIPHMVSRNNQDTSNSMAAMAMVNSMMSNLISFVNKELQVTKTAQSIDSLKALNSNVAELGIELSRTISSLNLGEIRASIQSEFKGLVEELKKVQLKEVKLTEKDIKSLSPKEVNFPKFPTSIEVSNLLELRTKLEQLIESVEAINIKSPDSVVVSNLKEITESINVKQELNLPKEVVGFLENLRFLSDSPDKALSVRLSDGERFYQAVEKYVAATSFQSSAYKDVEGGSAPAVLDDNNFVKTTEDNLKLRIENTTISGADYPLYIGKALPGTATSTANWQIRKLTYSGIYVTQVDWADGDDLFNNIWDNRSSLSYS